VFWTWRLGAGLNANPGEPPWAFEGVGPIQAAKQKHSAAMIDKEHLRRLSDCRVFICRRFNALDDARDALVVGPIARCRRRRAPPSSLGSRTLHGSGTVL
jgi:hypothetical protein